MRAIRRKIYFVIVMLVAAVVVSAAIYLRGGFAVAKREDIGYCGTVDPSPTPIYNPVALNGENLFKANCTSCHMMDKILTGPALRGIRDRMPDKLFEEFLLYPKKAVSTSIYLKNLCAQYDNMPHISFLGTLSKKDIDAIIMYCDTSDPLFYAKAVK